MCTTTILLAKQAAEVLIKPPEADNLSTTDEVPARNVSVVQRFHCTKLFRTALKWNTQAVYTMLNSLSVGNLYRIDATDYMYIIITTYSIISTGT